MWTCKASAIQVYRNISLMYHQSCTFPCCRHPQRKTRRCKCRLANPVAFTAGFRSMYPTETREPCCNSAQTGAFKHVYVSTNAQNTMCYILHTNRTYTLHCYYTNNILKCEYWALAYIDGHEKSAVCPSYQSCKMHYFMSVWSQFSLFLHRCLRSVNYGYVPLMFDFQ